MATLPMPRTFIRSPAWKEGATIEKATKKPSRMIPAPINRAKAIPRFCRCARVALRFYSLLHSQHFCQTHHSQRNTRTSTESRDGFRAVDRGRNHPAGFFGRFLNCCPFLPGGRPYKGSRHWQRCHRIRFSKYSAEFSCRLAVVMGGALSCG